MTLAPESSGPLGPHPSNPATPDFDLLRLSNLLGDGVVRMDAEGRAFPLNESGARLLEVLGGSLGNEAPPVMRDLLLTAKANGPQRDEMLTQTPDLRHVAIVVTSTGDGGLVMMRDHTDERLLQERLLQSEKMASVGHPTAAATCVGPVSLPT